MAGSKVLEMSVVDDGGMELLLGAGLLELLAALVAGVVLLLVSVVTPLALPVLVSVDMA